MKSKIYEIRVNPCLNNEKSQLIRGKITKTAVTFRKNKPNLKNIKIGVSSFETSVYEILSAWRSKKQTQFKPNSNPIPERPKMNTSSIITMNYINFPGLQAKKQTQTNPKQTQFRNYSGIQSSPERLFIKRMNRKQLQKDFPDFFPETSRYGLDRLSQIKYIIKLNFSCTNRIAMKQHFDTGFFEKICKED